MTLLDREQIYVTNTHTYIHTHTHTHTYTHTHTHTHTHLLFLLPLLFLLMYLCRFLLTTVCHGLSACTTSVRSLILDKPCHTHTDTQTHTDTHTHKALQTLRVDERQCTTLKIVYECVCVYMSSLWGLFCSVRTIIRVCVCVCVCVCVVCVCVCACVCACVCVCICACDCDVNLFSVE